MRIECPAVAIPLWILKHPTLKSTEKIFWATLKAEYGGTSMAPRRCEVAADVGISLDSVDRYYRALAAVGALRLLATATGHELELVESEATGKAAAHVPGDLRRNRRGLTLVEAPTPRTDAADQRVVRIEGSTVAGGTSLEYVRFNTFWALYPRHRDKATAQAWWLKQGVEQNTELWGTILAGLKRWIVVWEGEAREEQYVPYAVTWLRKRAYLDDEMPRPAVSKQTQGMISASHRFLKRHGA